MGNPQLRPVCVKCGVEMICARNDFLVVHFTDNDRKKGVDSMRYGDKYRCEECGTEIVTGYGDVIFGYDFLGEDLKKHEAYIKNYERENKFVEIKFED